MDIKDLEKEYMDSSFKVITDLQKKISKLEEENKSLQIMLSGAVPLVQNLTNDLGISNERLVCETQIYLLKEAAMRGSLTLEESRKFQIFTDILAEVKKINKNEDPEEVDVAVLLQLVKE